MNEPREYDAVLGGNTPLPPADGVVLGGMEGVKKRLASPHLKVRIAAVGDALNYGDAGLELAIAALYDPELSDRAHMLLRDKKESKVTRALLNFERIQVGVDSYEYAKTFATRKVETFDPQTGITDPVNIAYRLKVHDDEDEEEDITHWLEILLEDPQASQVEALVIGKWREDCYHFLGGSSEFVVNALVAAKNKLQNLKALFLGEIGYHESMIDCIEQSNISPILESYPYLEIVQVRGSNYLEFNPLQHDRLKALILETGELSREQIGQICALELPVLEHLELWLGRYWWYREQDPPLEYLMPVISGKLYPKLTYLGLRNSEYSDEIAEVVVDSLKLEFLKVLDLSMGTLTDKGAENFLNYSKINRLNILNVSENFLSEEMIEKLQQLDIQAIADNQKGDPDEKYRYCSVSE